ncbi:hypothetical protein KFU94_04665 [Chloroflexi bacterium TSY]|nr:hypothetical protein [Chloroflexi bacterium TSY]
MQSDQDWQERIRGTLRTATDSTADSINRRFLSGDQSNMIGPLVGLGVIVGLIFGLLIGWVIWPVDWTNIRPTHLDRDAQAQYLASVADAYVATKDGSSLDVARRRLDGIDLSTAIPAAVAYFASGTSSEGIYGEPFTGADAYAQVQQEDGNIRISNLTQLADAFGVAVAPLVQDRTNERTLSNELSRSEPVIVEPVPADLEPQENEALTASTGSGMINWLNWVLVFLGGVLLVSGGIYLAYRTQQTIRSEGNDVAHNQGEIQVGEDAAYGYTDKISNVRVRQDDMGQIDFEHQTDNQDKDEMVGGFSAILNDDLDQQTIPFVDDPNDEIDDTETWSHTHTLRPGRGVRPDGGFQMAEQSLFGTMIDQFVAQYHQGVVDYDEMRSIPGDQIGGGSIGEYGMGVNTKNGILLSDPKHVIAMDIWLFDKSDPQNLGNVSRILLSRYVEADADLRSTITNNHQQQSTSIIPRPGERFQLEGKKLTLDCEILDVVYTTGEPKGIFQQLTARLSVYS